MQKKFNLASHTQFFVFLSILLLKFFFIRAILFEGTEFFYTIFVEIGYILFLLGLVELLGLQIVKRVLYVAVNLFFSLLLLTILIYHDYFGYIVTFQAFAQVEQIGTIKDSILQLFDPIYLVLFADFVLLFIYYYFIPKRIALTDNRKPAIQFILPILIIGITLFTFNLFHHKDKEIANTVIAAEKQGIITYEILAAKSKVEIKPAPVLSKEQIEAIPSHAKQIKEIVPISISDLKLNGIAKDKNIIVIQAEAFQNFTLNLEIDGIEITPFLNELVKESLYFPNIYQQIGPGNSTDAEFLFNTSLYPSPLTPTYDTFSDREIPSFPKLLRKNGYKSITLQAIDVSFQNRDELYPALGFDQYYDHSFFGDDDIIGIGPSDEYVYRQAFPVLKKLHDHKQKFYAQIVTLSSHHPFKIPKTKKTLQLPKEYKDTFIGDYLQSIHYTDTALKQLVHNLKKEGMWDDTILVFYGDHFGLKSTDLKKTDLKLLKKVIGHNYTILEQFNIPFLITIGGHKISEVNETIGGQIDMMPTVANILGVSLDNHVYFGQDLINYPSNLLGVRYYMPNGSFFNNDIVFQTAEGFSDGEAFEIHTGRAIEDYSKYEHDYRRIIELMKLSDDYMNSLPKR